MHTPFNTREARKATAQPFLTLVPGRRQAVAAAPSSPRLALVECRNDDGHVIGLESHWIPLGTAVNSVLARLAGERQ
jgi:hypothetical protein